MSNPGFLESISPWASRSSTPKPIPSKDDAGEVKGSPLGLKPQQGGDHRISHRPRFSLKNYPDDCPPLNVRWFYAVDVPKRKPAALSKPTDPTKPPPPPKKYVAFSARDSRAIELAFQGLADDEEAVLGNEALPDLRTEAKPQTTKGLDNTSLSVGTKTPGVTEEEQPDSVRVPVNEDFLFDVDIEKRELAPAYWLGPIYDVRRGSWFYSEGSTLRPCEENLAVQLEEGYVKARPWNYELPRSPRSASHMKSKSASSNIRSDSETRSTNLKTSWTLTSEDSQSPITDERLNATIDPPKFQLQTHRLFGNYMNSVVTYQDSTVAWLLTDDFLSRMSSTVYQRFAGGGHLGGIKVVRGFIEPTKKEIKLEGETASEIKERGRAMSDTKRRSMPASMGVRSSSMNPKPTLNVEVESDKKKNALKDQMASLVASPDAEDAAAQEEEIRKRDENEIQDDYRDADEDDQKREIECLILVTHGIGQRLGLKLESVNFVHDVNVLRKTIKSVYGNSPDLQALNSDLEKLPKNSRIQVLPIVWRHLLDFPKQSLRRNRKEQDLGDLDPEDEEEYPSLTDITVEGVPAIRNLISDLALDILLYQSAYREHIAGIVQLECNRVYELFKQRNPNFKGKVSLIGHSLGSAILFDVLCRQKEVDPAPIAKRKQHRGALHGKDPHHDDKRDLHLNFDVQDFYCLGSPLGLFQMLKGRTIAGRRTPNISAADSPMAMESSSADVHGTSRSARKKAEILSIAVSSPKCDQLFNIFHPTDPIAYRIEPLVSSAMSSMKPQPLPYTKKGIFGDASQGLTNIGARVGQSVSDFWSNIATGVASSLLNRSLGLTHEPYAPPAKNQQLSAGAGTNIAGGVISGPEALEEEKRKNRDVAGTDTEVEHPMTLIDTEIETLYSGFQKRKKGHQSDEGRDLGESPEWQEAEERGRRLRREEAKIRALNSTGRLDFSIQEGVFDISLIASIASHLSYWADEDVCHFMISQLLSRQRVVQRN
ncbi:MAG: hypothetical protein MMC33_002684 [Icmadophila ericetorum]|nr:hypothetical protein [Icmadophila ericetorum]